MADFSNDYEIAYDESRRCCTIRFRCFDTPNSVTLYERESPDFDAEALLLEVRRRCLTFHRLWSFSLPESDVSRLNRPCSSVEVDESTARLVQAMKDFHEVEPAFDFTVGSVSYLWKHAKAVPGDLALHEALEHVGADKIFLDGYTVVKSDPLLQVDVGGAAKGFAADEIAALLRDAGVTSADVDLGGNLYMIGSHPSGRAWRVSVRVPGGSGPILEVVDRSVVTSGTYERFAEIDGVRYHHVIDARTGWPSTGDVMSATVVAESSLIADMLATTALLVNVDDLARRHPDERLIAIGCDGVVLR